MRNLAQLLNIDKNQRIVNGLVFLILHIWIIYNLSFVHRSSDIGVYYRFYLLKLIALIYFAQVMLNNKWLNSILLGIYVTLMVCLIYGYSHAFFDNQDAFRQSEFGFLRRTWGTIVMMIILTFILWVTLKLRPVKMNSMNANEENET